MSCCRNVTSFRPLLQSDTVGKTSDLSGNIWHVCTAIYGLWLCAAVKGIYGFQAVYSRIGCINQSIWVQNRVSFFRKLISWLKILCRLRTIRFCFGQTLLVTSVVSNLVPRAFPLKNGPHPIFKGKALGTRLSSFWKTATLGQGGFGEFTLVQGSKLQLNQLWYRLRVPRSQRHIPTQKFLKYPPGWVVENQHYTCRDVRYLFLSVYELFNS